MNIALLVLVPEEICPSHYHFLIGKKQACSRLIEFIEGNILIQRQTLVAPGLAGVPVEILFWKVLHVEYFTLDVTSQQKH